MMPKLSRVCEVHLMKIKLFFCFSLFNEHLSFDQVLEMLSINLADDSAWNRGDKMHTTIKSFLVSHVICNKCFRNKKSQIPFFHKPCTY